MKNITTILLIFLSIPAFSFQNNKDSIRINELTTSVRELKGSQSIVEGKLDVKFEKLSIEFKKEKNMLYMVGGLLSLLGLLGIVSAITMYRRVEKTVETKFNNKFDKIITEKEGDILKLIDHQSKEKRYVKNKKILVLTGKDGDDTFLRDFFKIMEFPINNVNYEKVEKYEKPKKKYDLIFVNNEKAKIKEVQEGDIDFNIINSYFGNSEPETVLFYFNSNRKNYNNDKVADRLSFASAKTQIYGNLLNLFKYQELLLQKKKV
jgi:hypothetical protein